MIVDRMGHPPPDSRSASTQPSAYVPVKKSDPCLILVLGEERGESECIIEPSIAPSPRRRLVSLSELLRAAREP